jgi:WD40 repeat protein
MVWDLKTGKTHWKRDEALGAAFSPNGKLLALSSVAGVIELWDVAEQRLVGKLTGHAGQCGWLGFKEISGRLLLASTGSDRTIRVWDVESQRGLLTLSGHGAGVTCVAFSKSGDRLFSSSQDGTLRVWGLSFDGGFRRYPIKYQPGQGLVFLDKDLLVVPGSDGGFLNLRTHKQTALPGSPRAVAFARSAGLLAVSSTNAIVLYDTKKRDGDGLPQRRGQMATEKGEMACLALNEPADRVYLVRKMLHAGVIDSFLEARVVPTGELQWSTRLDGLATILHLAVSPDGKVLATASLAGAIELRDPLTGQVTKKLLPSSTDAGVFVALRSVAFSPDGKLLAAGTGNGARAGERPDVYLWDLKTYAPRRLRGHDALIAGVAFAPDGKRLATASIDFNRGQSGEVKLWDVETGEEMLTLPGAMAVAFTADDQRLAAFAYEEFNRPVVRVWEAFAEKEIKQKEEGEEEKASPP